MIEKILTFISENWMLFPNEENKMKEKSNITLIISKNVTTIYDHWFDIIDKPN